MYAKVALIVLLFPTDQNLTKCADHYANEVCIYLLQLSCFLVLAWEAFALWEKKDYWEVPVEFLDVLVHMPVQAERGKTVSIGVVFNYSNHFEVCHACGC